MIQRLAEDEILQACQTLFGSGVDVNRGFLFYLQPEGARSAYRRKAKETHPDAFAGEPPGVLHEQASLFRDIVEAYDIVTQFFSQRENGLWLPPAQARVSRRQDRQRSGAETPDCRNTSGPSSQRPLPLRPMQVGHFLFTKGIITYRMLIEALVWQRKQRPVIGNLAMRWGWLGMAEIERIIKSGACKGRFGEKAVDLDLLSSFQVKTLLSYQYSQQERLGTYFVRKNILTGEELEHMIRELREHNKRVLRAASTRNVRT